MTNTASTICKPASIAARRENQIERINLPSYPETGEEEEEKEKENPTSQTTTLRTEKTTIIPSFTLECGTTLHNIPVAYTTYGTLSQTGNNGIVICHDTTDSGDIPSSWMGLLSGPFDLDRFFVVCCNVLGSPYGSGSPVTARDGREERARYGPGFPLTTIRDDVGLFRVVLDGLGVRRIAAVMGSGMGGMHVLEFAYLGTGYVRSVIAVATSARHSAWGIGWGEVQRQNIYADGRYCDGYYGVDGPPVAGLRAARMSGLLVCRARDGVESRFGRRRSESKEKVVGAMMDTVRKRPATPPDIPETGDEKTGDKKTNDEKTDDEQFRCHNEALRKANSPRDRPNTPVDSPVQRSQDTLDFNGIAIEPRNLLPTTTYSAQSHLRHEAEDFTRRFDANCYIALTRKLDTHDVARDRADTISAALAMIEQPALIIGVQSDMLFQHQDSEELAAGIPKAQLRTVVSPHGHDAALLEFEQIDEFVRSFVERELSDLLVTAQVVESLDEEKAGVGEEEEVVEQRQQQQQQISQWKGQRLSTLFAHASSCLKKAFSAGVH